MSNKVSWIQTFSQEGVSRYISIPLTQNIGLGRDALEKLLFASVWYWVLAVFLGLPGPISAGSVSWKLGNQWVFESAPLVFGDMFMHGMWLQFWLLKFYRSAFSVFLAQGQLPSWFVWGPRKLSHERNRNVLVGFQSIGKRYGKMMRGVFNPTVHSIHREAKRPKMLPIRMGRPRDPNLGLSPGFSPTWFVHICKCRCHSPRKK